MSNPYATLNVPEDAGKDQIRGAFVRVARSIHPDKAGASQDANEMYSQVDEAWKILSDPQMRDAYDTFGENGPTALQALRTQLDTKRISKQMLKAKLKLAEQMQLEEEMSTNSAVTCSLKLDDLLRAFRDPAQRDVDWSKLATLEHVLLEQTTVFSLTPNDTLVLQAAAGTARHRKRPILGSFTMGLFMNRGLNSISALLSFNATAAQAGRQKQVLPRLTLKGSRQVTKQTLLGLEFHGDFNTSFENELEPGLQAFCTRKFSAFTEINVFWGFGSAEGLGVGIKHTQRVNLASKISTATGSSRRQFDCKLEINAAEASPSVKLSWMEPLALERKIKTLFSASASHVIFELEKTEVLSDRTRVGGALAVAFPEGIRFKFKLARAGGVRYEFPIFITPNITLWNALLTGLIPLAFSLVVQRLMLPFRQKSRLARRRALVEECKAWRARAKNQTKLMLGTSEANKRNACGLEVVFASYGAPNANREDVLASWEDDEVLPPSIDVTTQLNFFVSKQHSVLDLGLSPKSGLLGFYDPSLVRGEDGVWAYDPSSEDEEEEEGAGGNVLFIRYKYQDRMYEVSFEDEDAVHLPSEDAVQVAL